MKIGIASDHAGYQLKEKIKAQLLAEGYALQDFGTHSDDAVDYPDFVHPLAQAIGQGEIKQGILICGSGNGVCITANKYPFVRAGMAWKPELATLTRQHNNANVLCLPARFINDATAAEIVTAFLSAEFEGGRHQRRVTKIEIPNA